MLFITLFSLVFQVPAGVFEFCSQTSRENSRLESQKDIILLTLGFHRSNAFPTVVDECRAMRESALTNPKL